MKKATLMLPKGWTTDYAILAFQMRGYGLPKYVARLKKDFLSMAGNGTKRWKLFERAFDEKHVATTHISDYKPWPVLGYDAGGQVPGYVDEVEAKEAKFIVATLFEGQMMLTKKRAELTAELNAMKRGDKFDECHERADEILLVVLDAMGESKLVEAYKAARKRVEFYYA